MTHTPDSTGALRALDRKYERITRNESHAHLLRTGVLTCMSSIAWGCGFSRERRVLVTADVVRALAPSPGAAHPAITELLDERAGVLLRAAATCARTVREPYAQFEVSLSPGEAPTSFTLAVEALGSAKAVVVVGWAGTDPDAAPPLL
ncbi:hypothetical protein ACFWGN_15025 [Oerskovia sp. NPDC060338]|uniref:hypothetical protein n=1 Tax=Oerskovia sp. NPDC060338 TaxID=3347100 RepID=UPI00365DE684